MQTSKLMQTARTYEWEIKSAPGKFTRIISPFGSVRIYPDQVEAEEMIRLGFGIHVKPFYICMDEKHKYRQATLSYREAMAILAPMQQDPPKPDEIEAEREIRRLTMNDAAEIAGVSYKTWSNWETGEFKMAPEKWHEFLRKAPAWKPARRDKSVRVEENNAKRKAPGQHSRKKPKVAGALSKSAELRKLLDEAGTKRD